MLTKEGRSPLEGRGRGAANVPLRQVEGGIADVPSAAPAQSYYMGHCRDRLAVPFYNLLGFALYLTLPLDSTSCNVWVRNWYHFFKFWPGNRGF